MVIPLKGTELVLGEDVMHLHYQPRIFPEKRHKTVPVDAIQQQGPSWIKV